MKSKIVQELIDLRRSKKEKLSTAPQSESSDAYPYGTRLSFEEEEVKKLGIEDLKADQTVHVIGLGVVESVSIRESVKGGKRHDISIQIKKVVIKPSSPKDGK